jgi:hypothetical protein
VAGIIKVKTDVEKPAGLLLKMTAGERAEVWGILKMDNEPIKRHSFCPRCG